MDSLFRIEDYSIRLHARRGLPLIVAGILIGIVVPLFVESEIISLVQLILGGVLPVLSVIIMLCLARYTFHADLVLVNPLVLVTVYWILLFTVEPVLIVVDQQNSVPYIRLMSDQTVRESIFLAGWSSSFSYIIIAFGYLTSARLISFSSRLTPRLPRQEVSSQSQRERIKLGVLTMICLGTIGLIGYADRIPLLLNTPQDRSEIISGTGYLFSLVLSFLALPIIWMSLAKGKPNWRCFIPVSLVSASALALFGGRSKIAESVVASAFAYIIFRRPPLRRSVWLLSVLGISLSAFLALFFAIRLAVQQSGGGSLVSEQSLAELWIYGLRHMWAPYDNYVGYFDTIGAYPEFRVFQLVEILWLNLLPTAIVGPKPLDPSQVLFQSMYGIYGRVVGTPFTLVGLLHYSGGWFMVILGSLMFGLILRIAYEWVVANSTNPTIVAIYSYFLARLFMWVWGIFSSGFLLFVQVELMILVAMGWSRIMLGSVRRAQLK